MRPRHLLMGVALVVSAAMVVLGGDAPDDTVAQPVVRAPRAEVKAPGRQGAMGSGEPGIARLVPRAMLVGEAGEAQGAPDAMFGTQDWNPPPPKAADAAPPPPPPPSAPPLPFSYIGKAAANGKWEVFLARADKTYIVQANTVIDGIYRVDAIAPPMLTLTYLPLNQVQTLNIGVLD